MNPDGKEVTNLQILGSHFFLSEKLALIGRVNTWRCSKYFTERKNMKSKWVKHEFSILWYTYQVFIFFTKCFAWNRIVTFLKSRVLEISMPLSFNVGIKELGDKFKERQVTRGEWITSIQDWKSYYIMVKNVFTFVSFTSKNPLKFYFKFTRLIKNSKI